MTPERWRRIEEIFHAVLEQEPNHREEFLRDACAGDEALCQDVRSLLASYGEEGLQEMVSAGLAAELLGEVRARCLLGGKVGHYEIQSLLGSGGMGVVYRALDLKLGRTVGLKILPQDFAANEKMRERFVREARAASALSHPNITTIYEIGEYNGIDFIAMECAEGETLEARINGCPLALEEILEVGSDIADALDEAHQKGIIHRDIKPANIIITPSGRAKVLDFGLAKFREPEGAGRARLGKKSLTSPGVIVGTAESMSPEQVLERKVDHRSDIFSLGVTLYAMSTGRFPFTGETATEVMARVLHFEPEAICRFNSEAPDELERIVRKCLVKDPQRRYQSAREILVDLKRLREGLIPPRKGQPAFDRRIAVRGWTLRVLILVAAAILVLLLPPLFEKSPASPPEIKSLAVLPLADLSPQAGEEYFSDGLTEALITDLAKMGTLRVISRTSVMRYRETRQPLPEIARELGVDAILEGSVIRSGDRVRIHAQLIHGPTDTHLWADSYERGRGDVLVLQREIARAIADEIRLQLTPGEDAQLAEVTPIDWEAHEAYLRGRYFWNKRTEEDLDKAIMYFQQAIELEPGYALAYAGLADAYALLNPYRGLPPRESYPKSKEVALKALELDPTLAEAHTSLALVQHEYEWDFVAAESSYRRALELNPNYATAHQGYAEFLTRMGRHEEAIAEIRRAQELDPLSLIVNSIAGWVLQYARQYDAAIRQLQKTLRLDSNFVQAHNYLGMTYLARGDFNQAVSHHRKAYALSGNNPRYLYSLGVAYALSGNRSEARRVLDELRSLSRSSDVPAFHFASVHLALGEKELALASLEKSYQERGVWMLFLNVDPLFDRLRDDPRFHDLLRRIGFKVGAE